MATSDMSLGGGAGFGAGYTPIRFAPLVSLTGPVMAPATPAAPEAAAPMLRPPMMADQGGGYETPQRTDDAFQNLQPIGTRIQQGGIGPELRDLGRGLSFMTSPLMSTGSLLATGKLPLDYVLGEMGGAAQPGGQGTTAAPFGGFLQGLQNFLFGPQRESVSLAGGQMMSPGLATAAMNDAYSQALEMGMSPESAANAMSMTQSLMALGMDPYQAAGIASQHAGDVAAYNTPIAPVGQAQGLPGLSRNQFDLTAPVAPQAAQAFGLGDSSMGVSSTDFGFDPGGGVGAAPSSAAAGMGPGW
jgi:hypothetical protein